MREKFSTEKRKKLSIKFRNFAGAGKAKHQNGSILSMGDNGVKLWRLTYATKFQVLILLQL